MGVRGQGRGEEEAAERRGDVAVGGSGSRDGGLRAPLPARAGRGAGRGARRCEPGHGAAAPGPEGSAAGEPRGAACGGGQEAPLERTRCLEVSSLPLPP